MLQASIYLVETGNYIKFMGDIDEEFNLKDTVTYFGSSDGTVFKVDLTLPQPISRIQTGQGTGIVIGVTSAGHPIIHLKAQIQWILADAIYFETTGQVAEKTQVIQQTPKPVAPVIPLEAFNAPPTPTAKTPSDIKTQKELGGQEPYLSHEEAQERIKNKKIPYGVLVEEPVQDLGEVTLIKEE